MIASGRVSCEQWFLHQKLRYEREISHCSEEPLLSQCTQILALRAVSGFLHPTQASGRDNMTPARVQTMAAVYISKTANEGSELCYFNNIIFKSSLRTGSTTIRKRWNKEVTSQTENCTSNTSVISRLSR